MGDSEAKLYYVLTLKGQQGPLDKQGVKELVLAGGARGDDQVRNAFGRNLGTVRELCGPIRHAGGHRPESSVSDRRSAVPAHERAAAGGGSAHAAATTSGRSLARSAAPAPSARRGRFRIVLIILAIGAVLMAGGLALSQRAGAVQPAPAAAVPPAKPVPAPVPVAVQAPVYRPLPLPLPLPPPPAVQCQVALGRAVATADHPSAGEVLGNLFDGAPDSKWLAQIADAKTTGAKAWIHLEPLAGRNRIAGYALTSANDYAERDPSSWRLIGIAADGRETQLDARSGERWVRRFERRVFMLKTAAECSAYRLDILALGGASSVTQLAELELISP